MTKCYIVNYKNSNGLLTLAYAGVEQITAIKTYLNLLGTKENISELKLQKEIFYKNGAYELKNITQKINKAIAKL